MHRKRYAVAFINVVLIMEKPDISLHAKETYVHHIVLRNYNHGNQYRQRNCRVLT